jgi:hypothetical protein
MGRETTLFFYAGGFTMHPLLVNRWIYEKIYPNFKGITESKTCRSFSMRICMTPSRFWELLFPLKKSNICKTLSANFLARRTSRSSVVV